MLRRILAFLLLLAVPVQGFAVPHWHGATGDAQHTGHELRPHLHLGGHHHGHQHGHGHSHSHGSDSHPSEEANHSDEGSGESTVAPFDPANHDRDAVYAVGELGLNIAQDTPCADRDGLPHLYTDVLPKKLRGRSSVDAIPRPHARGRTPVYLATLSLRL